MGEKSDKEYFRYNFDHMSPNSGSKFVTSFMFQ
jgi:hypothetical protein